MPHPTQGLTGSRPGPRFPAPAIEVVALGYSPFGKDENLPQVPIAGHLRALRAVRLPRAGRGGGGGTKGGEHTERAQDIAQTAAETDQPVERVECPGSGDAVAGGAEHIGHELHGEPAAAECRHEDAREHAHADDAIVGVEQRADEDADGGGDPRVDQEHEDDAGGVGPEVEMEDEFADVMGSLILLGIELNIDIGQVVERKITYTRQRLEMDKKD